jgi:hypothetical protein
MADDDDGPVIEVLDDGDSDDDDMPALNGAQHSMQALIGASLDGNLNRVRELLGEGDLGVNSSDSQGFTALFAASQGGHVALVCTLQTSGKEYGFFKLVICFESQIETTTRRSRRLEPLLGERPQRHASHVNGEAQRRGAVHS